MIEPRLAKDFREYWKWKNSKFINFLLIENRSIGIGCCFYLKIMDRRLRCGDAGSPSGGDLW
jgi:hypothetical protein